MNNILKGTIIVMLLVSTSNVSMAQRGIRGLKPRMPAKAMKAGFSRNARGITKPVKKKSLVERATHLKQRIRGNGVNISTPKTNDRFDLAGKAHGGIPTPHVNPLDKSFKPGAVHPSRIGPSRKRGVRAMTERDLRTVRKHLDKKKIP